MRRLLNRSREVWNALLGRPITVRIRLGEGLNSEIAVEIRDGLAAASSFPFGDYTSSVTWDRKPLLGRADG
jgi:hypothetical protein